jgi:SAM-dependent methyltransferase
MTPLIQPAARRAVTLTAYSLLLLALGACGTPTGPRPSGLPDGINDSFLDESLNVEKYVERFEGESRAVFAERHAIVNALELAPGDAVADIGAGTGFFSFLIADAVGRTGQVYAVEISPRFLDHLREQADVRGVSTMQVVEGTTESVELPRASTDLAFICDVYHHFETPEATLASLHEAIRPDGTLVVIEFHRVPGETSKFLLEHVRAGREVFQSEIEAAGFTFLDEITLPGLDDNYILRFRRN